MAKCRGCGRRAIHDHHLVKQQRIRKRLRTLVHRLGHAPYRITWALEDKRLQVPLCGTCHPEVEDERLQVELPDGFWDAVDAYSLAPDLPRWVGILYDERLIAMRAEEDETEDAPPAHVPGQINLDGEVETAPPPVEE